MPRRESREPTDTPMLQMPLEEARERIGKQIDKGKELLKRSVQTSQEFEEVAAGDEKWQAYNASLMEALVGTAKLSNDYFYAYGGGDISEQKGMPGYATGRIKGIKARINALGSIAERLELIPVDPGIREKLSDCPPRAGTPGGEVFLVHGHDQGAREAVARALKRLTGRDPIQWHVPPAGCMDGERGPSVGIQVQA